MSPDERVLLGRLLVSLYKGVVYRDADEVQWGRLMSRQAALRAHFAAVGLEVGIDEGEGFAYLKSSQSEGDPEIPRLIVRRPLTYLVSLILVLLRKKLLEADHGQGDLKLVLGRDELVEMVRVFLPAGTNEAKVTEQVKAALSKITELGFLRHLPAEKDTWEVRRVLKAFVDAQWLADFHQRLESYRTAGVREGSE